MRAEDLVDGATARLKEHRDNFDSPNQLFDHAVELLQHVLGRDFNWDEDINGPISRRYHRLVERHTTGEPLPYIVGYAEFKDLKLIVRPGGFIPRATTEFLVDSAVAKLRRRSAPVAVDAAAGIGPIALAMAHAVPHARVYGTDISAAALRQAKTNARALGLRNVTFHRGSMLDALPRRLRGAVDVIASHPPYVAREDIADLPAEVKDFEPTESLTDDTDGFGLIEQLIGEAAAWLRPDGWLMLEVGTYIARPVRTLLTRARYREVRSTKGDMPYTRVLVARPPA